MADPHEKEWRKFLSIYENSPLETLQYRARCIQGLLTGITQDYTEIKK